VENELGLNEECLHESRGVVKWVAFEVSGPRPAHRARSREVVSDQVWCMDRLQNMYSVNKGSIAQKTGASLCSYLSYVFRICTAGYRE
jgi:hypothetical protein